MPQTTVLTSPGLSIRLEGTQDGYSPGDTIVGYVHRKVSIVSPDAVVKIYLHGRSKSKMTVSHGQSTSRYRGRFNLIAPTYGQKIFEGTLHIPPGEEQSWPFAVTLPTHVDHKYLAPGVPQEQSYLNLDKKNVVTHPLPSSFAVHQSGFATNMEGFVEYVLEAKLQYAKASTRESCEAQLPIRVTRKMLDPPIADFQLKRWQQFQSITSWHLIPEMETAKLTFSQKTKKMFGTSSVPVFKFQLQVDVPSVLQLDNPNHFQFKVRAVPSWEGSSEVLRDVYPKIRLTSLVVQIESHTEIICEGTMWPHTADTKHTVSVPMNGVLFRKEPVYIPCNKDWPALDLGELLNMRISSRELSPNFTTYNIKRTHSLYWKLEVDVVGESTGGSGTRMIKILPASDERGAPAYSQGGESSSAPPPFSSVSHDDSWIQPPAETVSPPSFAQVKEEIISERGDKGKQVV